MLTYMYQIFRLTNEGYFKDIGYTPYRSYIKAEQVVKGLKKSYPKRKFKIETVIQ